MSILRDRRKEVRDMTVDDARKELVDSRRKLFDLRMQATRGEVKDFRQFTKVRKDIARLVHKIQEAEYEAALGLDEPEFLEAADDDAEGAEEEETE